jgi:hypothetical protein
MLLIPFILNAEEIMTQEGAEADEVTGQQREAQDDEGDGKNHPELYELIVEGFQPIGIRQQETRQEEVVEQINIQGSGADILQGP